MTTALLLTAGGAGMVHVELDGQAADVPETLRLPVRRRVHWGAQVLLTSRPSWHTFRRVTRGAEPTLYEEVVDGV